MKKLLSLFVLGMSLQINLDARSFLPSLGRLRDKMNKILDSSEGESLKDIIRRSQDAHKKGESVGNIVTSVILSATGCSHKSLPELKRQLSGLYWVNQKSFIKELGEAFSRSKKDALVVMETCFSRRFLGKKSTLVAFAVELQREENELQECITDILRLLDQKNSKKKEFSCESVQKELDRAMRMRNELDGLTSLANTIFMST